MNQEILHNELVAASDSDWGTDILTRRSQSGWAIVMNGGVISYGSKAQKVISLSSSEAEIYASSVVTKRVKMYRNLLQAMGFRQSRPTIAAAAGQRAMYSSVDREESVFSAETHRLESQIYGSDGGRSLVATCKGTY